MSIAQYITPRGMLRLQNELAHIRLRIQELTARLRQHNGEVFYQLQDREMLIARARELAITLDHAKPTTVHHDVAELGSAVYLKNNEGQQRYVLVNSIEADPIMNYVSIHSPLGSAIKGKHPGEIVRVTTPLGQRAYVLTGIE